MNYFAGQGDLMHQMSENTLSFRKLFFEQKCRIFLFYSQKKVEKKKCCQNGPQGPDCGTMNFLAQLFAQKIGKNRPVTHLENLPLWIWFPETTIFQ